ncbi:MAG: protocatechuate 3,4-dioxygenase [Planctomycetales bacterium]
MLSNGYRDNRRWFLSKFALGAAAFTAPGVFAEELTRTPRQGEGPFYPNKLPLDTDNDLLIINDGLTPAVGEVTHLSGRILDAKGNPLRNAIVEIWQADNTGTYIHTGSVDRAKRGERDQNFQGFGRFLTGSSGEYYFRTIKPRPYGPRTAHVHFAVKKKGMERFTTECYVKGEAKNKTDFVLNRVKDLKARQSLIVDFAPVKESRAGELAAKFDVVLGFTPKA